MPETKYTTLIYLAVRGNELDEVGPKAVRVYQDFIGRLHRAVPNAKNFRLAVETPAPRKGTEGVFEVWSNLKAEVPDSLTSPGAANVRDAWRSILKTTFNYSCHHNHELVYHTSSRVDVTREMLPSDDVVEAPAPVETKPKEMIPVKVILGGKEFNVEIPKAENLLDGVNDKGVDVKWDCKNGVCDTCKVHVASGMENLSPTTDAEVNMLGDDISKGYRLACQVTANGPCAIKQ